MFRINSRGFAAALGAVALLATAGAAPRAAAAATMPTHEAAAPHQYVGYGYYGFPSPYTPFQSQAVNYPGSGAAAWIGYSAPYSSSGYPYGGYAYPYVAYGNPSTAYAYGSAVGGPYSGGPGNPYTAWGAGYGNAAGPTAAGPTAVPPIDSGTYWDSTGYYVP
jgi:hypothetical protein